MNPSPVQHEVLDDLIAVVGNDGVVFDAAAVERESRTCIPYRALPDCIVYPRSTGEVQSIVRLAQANGIPIWPVSTGKNWGYGEKSATYPGGITMVLERMRAIVTVDERLGFALIEPGVTYRDLNTHLKANGIALWSDCAGTTESASVIGNALDKGRGLTPYADHFGALCGMEVVLPDGSLLRTGHITDSVNKVWNLYKWGVGPYLDGLFAQSNLGIVVKAGVWLMPAPAHFDFLAFEYTKSLDRFPQMIEDLRRLVFEGVLRSRPHIANDFAMLCILSQYPRHRLDGAKRLGAAALEAWRREHGVGPWTFGCGLYGSASEVRDHRKRLRHGLRDYGKLWSFGRATEPTALGRVVYKALRLGARFSGKSPAFLEQVKPAADLFRGIPTNEFAKQVYFKSGKTRPSGAIDPPRDGCGFIWIGPIVPFRAEDVMDALARARRTFDHHEFDFFVEIIVESPRALLLLFGVFYERNDEEDADRAKRWYEALRAEMIAAGYPPYRETSQSMTGLFDQSPVTGNLLAAIKNALDPTHTIAPGRYGIR